MFEQEQITNFWDRLFNGEVVEGVTKVISHNDTICIRTGVNQTECYSRKNAEFPWERVEFVGESLEFL